MTPTDAEQILAQLIDMAKAQGADAADALVASGSSVSYSQRLRMPERVESQEGRELGLRVLIGKRQAIVSSSDMRPEALPTLVERVVSMAKLVPEDPYCGLADTQDLAENAPTMAELDLCDPTEPTAEFLKEQAQIAEEAALSVAGITNSEGANAGWSRTQVSLAASNGFQGSYDLTRHWLSASVLAGEGTDMERDYDYDAKVYASDMASAEAIGRSAAERTLKRMNARQGKTATNMPVMFDPRISNSLVGHLASAINGSAIARGTSFLKECLQEQIFPENIMIIDDPHRVRGLRSKPFDDEGVANQKREMISNGVLTGWFMDQRAARQLSLKSTGHAARGASSPPSPAPTNLYLQAGTETPAEMMRNMGTGLYVTELLGMGVNGITGDYSRGAAGFWVENGEIAYPVSEITIASNLKDMFKTLRAANDLSFKYGTNAPTLLVEGMTLAGA